jgi:RNA polymerase sigma-70 factor (ECF subfamily)
VSSLECNQSKTKTKISTFQIHIVEKCKQNDRQAQMQLYNQYCNGMLIVALRFVKDTMEAEDVVQEAFIKAFSKLDQYKAEVSFGAWLKRIVINRCIDVLKSKRQRLIELEGHHLNVVDFNDDNEWLVDDAITVDEVKAAIERLPDKYKFVVKLYLIEGYDHNEIAEILSITEVASRTQLSRGKLKLQNELKFEKNGTRS